MQKSSYRVKLIYLDKELLLRRGRISQVVLLMVQLVRSLGHITVMLTKYEYNPEKA
jgi:hypothetical protein